MLLAHQTNGPDLTISCARDTWNGQVPFLSPAAEMSKSHRVSLMRVIHLYCSTIPNLEIRACFFLSLLGFLQYGICDFRNRILTKRLQELNWRSGGSIHTNFPQIRREIFEVSRAFTCIYFSWFSASCGVDSLMDDEIWVRLLKFSCILV